MDLSAVQTLLDGLGPWGVLIGIGLTFLAKYLQAKVNPVAPSPAPSPAPDAPSDTPILDALLKMLKDRLTKPKAEAVGALPDAQDIDGEAAAKLLSQILQMGK